MMASKKVSSKSKTVPAKSKAATAKTAVKKAQAKMRGAVKSGKKLKPVSSPAWPQAMSAGGAVVAHAIGKVSKNDSGNGRARAPAPELKSGGRSNEALARSEMATTWLAPWGPMSRAASQLMLPDALKSAMDRQFRIYQTMARFSPLTLALQMVQGLLPTDRPRSQPQASRRH